MADTIRIERWATPWVPAHDAELVETFNYYDIPLVGIVRQHGVDYLFTCLAGHTADVNVWAYAVLAEAHKADLRASRDEELHAKVRELLAGGPLVLALASEESGILGSTVLSTVDELDRGVQEIRADFEAFLEEQRRRAAAAASIATERSA